MNTTVVVDAVSLHDHPLIRPREQRTCERLNAAIPRCEDIVIRDRVGKHKIEVGEEGEVMRERVVHGLPAGVSRVIAVVRPDPAVEVNVDRDRWNQHRA